MSVAAFAPAAQVHVKDNPLLEGLSADAASLLHKHVHEQDVEGGDVLWEAGAHVSQVYFPISGMISLRVPMKDGEGVEIGNVGREGGAGLHEAAGFVPVLTQGVMQAPGRVASISEQVFAAAMQEDQQIKRLAEFCKSWLMLQSQLLAACNAVHAADARLCRWLLRASDALGMELLPATQETIAHSLGVRRTTATLIAQQLQARGIISYSRGKIAIRDRAALQAAACSCYRLLGRARWPSELLRATMVE
jgi:CRP-like cAMP-binding protein